MRRLVGRSFNKSEFWHRIVCAVARPEPRFFIDAARSDQSVPQFKRMALAVLPEVFPSATAHGSVYGDAEQSVE